MTLWRISNHTDLTGMGGLRASGRWHTAGRPVVYLAEHPALCLAEVLAHDLDAGDLPAGYQWLRIETASTTRVESVRALPAAWTSDFGATRGMGDRWLRAGRTVLLRVPSALAPDSFNYLLNPAHQRARDLRVARAYRYPLDARLTRSRSA